MAFLQNSDANKNRAARRGTFRSLSPPTPPLIAFAATLPAASGGGQTHQNKSKYSLCSQAVTSFVVSCLPASVWKRLSSASFRCA